MISHADNSHCRLMLRDNARGRRMVLSQSGLKHLFGNLRQLLPFRRLIASDVEIIECFQSQVS